MMRMADQDRKLAEQDRKLAEQERKMAESDRSKTDDKLRSSDKQSEQEKRIAQLENNLADANKSKNNDSSQSGEERAAQEQRIAKLELTLAEAKKPPVPGTPPGAGWTPPQKVELVVEESEEKEEEEFTASEEMLDISDEDPGDDEDEMSEDEVEVDIPRPASNNGIRGKGVNQHNEDDTPKKSKAKAGDGEKRKPVLRPRKNPEPGDDLPETDLGSQPDYGEREPEPNGQHVSGSSVFDEYFELMEIAEGPELPGMVTAGGPLDLNLVASLVRWASIAKYRVGEERLSGILELYFQSRPISAALKDLLSQITDMADALSGDDDQTAQVCVDLIAHLHGILTGGLPLGQAAQVAAPAKG